MDFVGEDDAWSEALKMKLAQLESGNLCNLVKMCDTTRSSVDNRAICRIAVNSRIFNWNQPPDRSRFTSGTGTGFVLNHDRLYDKDTLYIVTAHHVIDNHIQIRVHFDEVLSESVEAVHIGSCPAMDVALLQIPDIPQLRDASGRAGLSFNPDPNADEHICALKKVTAIGFALGKPHLQTTAGVISGRITEPSRLQVDVAVNPGNSGGPLVDEDGFVVGVVTSGMTHAQGINYCAPINETMMCIERVIDDTAHVAGLFHPKQKVSLADTLATVKLGSGGTRSVPLLRGRIDDRREVVVPENVPRVGGVLTFRVDGAKEDVSVINAPLKPVFDALPSLNVSYTKTNQILVSTLDERCRSGVCINGVHPALSKPFFVPGDSYEVHSNHVFITRKDLGVVIRRRIIGEPTRDPPDLNDRGEIDARLANAQSFVVDGVRMSAAQGVLCPGDIICSIRNSASSESVTIDQQMRVEVNYWRNGPNDDKLGKLPFLALLDREAPGNVIYMDVYRTDQEGKTQIKNDVALVLQPELFPYRSMFADMEDINYACRGGVFVMVATKDHNRSWRMNVGQLMNTPRNKFSSVLIVTSMLPESPFSESDTIGVGDVVVAVNSHEVFTLDDYLHAWRTETSGTTVRDGRLVAMDPSALVHAEADEHAIVLDAQRSTTDWGDASPFDTKLVFRFADGQYRKNLRSDHIVTIFMRDGSFSSSKTVALDETDALVSQTYNDKYVTF